MKHCPVCRARFKKETVCYRCGTDLSLLLQIDAQTHVWLSIAIEQCMQGKMAAAQKNMQLALESNTSPFSLAFSYFIQQQQLNNRRIRLIKRLGKYAYSDFIWKRLLIMKSRWLVILNKVTKNIKNNK